MKRFIAVKPFFPQLEFYGDYVTCTDFRTKVWQDSGHWWKLDYCVGVVSSSYEVICVDDQLTDEDIAKRMGVKL